MNRSHTDMLTRVSRIPELLRDIENGEILVPAFQRGFVWNRDDVIELFDSIYRGYPIGVFLFWRSMKQLFSVKRDGNLPFPIDDTHFPVTYILDGVQRLSCLYGAFRWKEKTEPGSFNIIFDLNTEKFLYYNPKSRPEAYIHLSDLFSTRQLLEAHRDFMDREDGNLLVERSVNLYTAFQEYQVPTVIVTGRDPSEMATIFERLNTSGVALTTMDILAASVWSSEFDLNVEISKVQSLFREDDYGFSPDDIIRMIAILLDEEPSSRSLMRLRFRTALELRYAFDQLPFTLSEIKSFLKSYLQIPSLKFVPSKTHLLMLVKVFNVLGEMDERKASLLRSWFWSTGFNEDYRNTSDGNLPKLISAIKVFSDGNMRGFNVRLNLRTDDFLKRIFNRTRQFSLTTLAMLISQQPRSILSGEEIYIESSSYFEISYIVPLKDLQAEADETEALRRSVANILIVPRGGVTRTSGFGIQDLILSLEGRFGDESQRILESNLLTPELGAYLRNGKLQEFFRARAELLYNKALQLSLHSGDNTSSNNL